MDLQYFSHNGVVTPEEQASVPLASIEYQYGFGVYENIRVVNGVPYFLHEHIERLEESAKIIGLEHSFTREFVEKSVVELIEKVGNDTYNIKILLIGAASSEGAQLFILPLSPLFPDKRLYRDGAHTVTYPYERAFPHAKTLNMLQSYLAYREAKKAAGYDALLINRADCITEGTRTNFFCIKGRTLFSPPSKNILLGVTRKAVLHVALQNKFTLNEQDMPLSSVQHYDGAFLTSTSSKIVPIRSIDQRTLPPCPVALHELMHLFDSYLETCKGEIC